MTERCFKKKISFLYFIKWKILLFLFFLLFLCGVFSFVFDIEMQRCKMTYMYEYPEFKRYNIPIAKRNIIYKSYGLYRYSEGGNDDDRLRGIPILFIPGNSGSYKQVRSMASISRQISLKEYKHQMFDYFSVDLNEELSALSHVIIERQIEFVAIVIRHLVELYGNKKIEIVLVGHSMGGVIARAVLMRIEQNVDIRLIVCLASPLAAPVFGVNSELTKFYERVDEFWRNNQDSVSEITTISITGGNRDWLVWDGYGRIINHNQSIWAPVTSVKGVMTSTDHLCVVWCRQLVLVLVKMLYRSMTNNRSHKSSIRSRKEIISVFRDELLADPVRCDGNVNSYSFARLWLRPHRIIDWNDSRCLEISGRHSVTRPLRLQVTSSNCNQGNSESSAEMSHMGYTYKFHRFGNGNSLLLSVPIINQSNPMSMIVKFFNISSNCQHSITIYASLIDWIAQLIRIHFGRFPSVISSLLILQLFRSRPISILSLFIILINIGYFYFPSDISRLYYHLEIIDIFDLILLFCICAPLSRLISSLSLLLLHTFHFMRSYLWPNAILPSLLPSAHHQPIVRCILLFIPTFAMILWMPHLPVFAAFSSIMTFYILMSGNKKCFAHQSTVGAILMSIFIMQLPPFIAELHSIRNSRNILRYLRHQATGVNNLGIYFNPILFIYLVIIIFVTIKNDRTTVKLSNTNSMIQSSLSVILASGCILFGSIDILQCIPLLLASLIAYETFNY